MYDITLRGRAERTLVVALEDLVDEWPPDDDERRLTMRVADQSGLIAVICTLHDLGVSIEQVRRVP